VTFKVQLSPHAARAYKKLDLPIQSRMHTALDMLQYHPLTGPQIRRLKGRLREYYRYRVGDYRIVYVVDHQQQVVYVDYVHHRKDIYPAGFASLREAKPRAPGLPGASGVSRGSAPAHARGAPPAPRVSS